MKASYAANTNLETLLDPDANAWRGKAAETVALIGTPVGLQPTAAIRASWMNKRIGAIEKVSVVALHNGEFLAFRLEWADATEDGSIADNDNFPDAAAIALPAAENAPLALMGAPGTPVNAWYWRADQPDAAREISAEGLGSMKREDVPERWRFEAAYEAGFWQLELTLPGWSTLDASGRVAAAIWRGSAQERGGLKSVTPGFVEVS